MTICHEFILLPSCSIITAFWKKLIFGENNPRIFASNRIWNTFTKANISTKNTSAKVFLLYFPTSVKAKQPFISGYSAGGCWSLAKEQRDCYAKWAVFGFRKTLAESTREKRDCLPSLLVQEHISLFYRNSRKAILNPHQHRSKTIVLPKVFWVTFLQKRDGSRKFTLCLGGGTSPNFRSQR